MLRAVMLESPACGGPARRRSTSATSPPGASTGSGSSGLSKWDIAAGALIIREAGGRISDFRGGDGYLDSGNVVAGNPKIYAALSKLLAPFSRAREVR